MAAAEVIDLVALGEDFVRNPYPVYAALRERGPVHKVRIPEGTEAWLVVGYEAGRAMLTDPRLSKQWKNASETMPISSPAAGPHMLNTDPPDHGRLRKLVAREFTARRVEQLGPRVQEITDELLDAMAALPEPRTDLVDAFSFPLPISVICELLGVPMLDRAAFRAWTATILTDPDPQARYAATEKTAAYLSDLLEDKRHSPART